MATAVQELMSAPPVTCDAEASLADATALDARAPDRVGGRDRRRSIVGILTERDLLRGPRQHVDPRERTGHPVDDRRPRRLGLDEEVDRRLVRPDPSPLPAPPGGRRRSPWSASCRSATCSRVAQIRPADETGAEVPRGLEGVIVAETVGRRRPRAGGLLPLPPVLGRRAGRDAVLRGRLAPAVRRASSPTVPGRDEFAARSPAARDLPGAACSACCPSLATGPASPLDGLRTARLACSGPSSAGGSRRHRPRTARDPGDPRVCAVMPTLIMAARTASQQGSEPIPPRADLGYAANYLWMLTGRRHRPDTPGPSSSTWSSPSTTASTPRPSPHGSSRRPVPTWPRRSCGAIGALSGPLHGGAPSRALDMLDAHRHARPGRRVDPRRRPSAATGSWASATASTRPTIRARSSSGRRRSGSAATLVDFAEQVEQHRGRRPGRAQARPRALRQRRVLRRRRHGPCGIPRELFTPTFASSRAIGWSAHILEQAADNRLIRPAARYVGPPPPAAGPRPLRSDQLGGQPSSGTSRPPDPGPIAGRERRLLDPEQVEHPPGDPPPLGVRRCRRRSGSPRPCRCRAGRHPRPVSSAVTRGAVHQMRPEAVSSPIS